MKNLILFLNLSISGVLFALDEVTPLPNLMCDVHVERSFTFSGELSEYPRLTTTSELKSFVTGNYWYHGESYTYFSKENCRLSESFLLCERKMEEDKGAIFNFKKRLSINRLTGFIKTSVIGKSPFGITSYTFEEGKCVATPSEKKF